MIASFFRRLFGKKPRTLRQDIDTFSAWIVTALATEGYVADYTMESMKEIDRFIEEQSGEGGILTQNRGQILFALGAYVGQTVIKLYGGEWITDDNDPKGELEIAVKLPNGYLMWPVQKCIKRCQFGAQDSLYSYVRAIKELG